MLLCCGFVSFVELSVFFLFDFIMKTFFAGIFIASIGVSGIANLIDYAMDTVRNHAQQLNTQLEQIDANY